eukprot:CAMPEP_0177715152 /NCGR_PEP_ID=MMETSP0484_2-20121128/13839_1 /TAXON_ID=354590 /ORGANISM="Rhodomonas lens, Strain RHODO" /LENGTH=284 /DNA_ID=CAMNT_0019227127 /DNA_START=55 /DNA_END=905 /DNA_ORIENTATION=-
MAPDQTTSVKASCFTGLWRRSKTSPPVGDLGITTEHSEKHSPVRTKNQIVPKSEGVVDRVVVCNRSSISQSNNRSSISQSLGYREAKWRDDCDAVTNNTATSDDKVDKVLKKPDALVAQHTHISNILFEDERDAPALQDPFKDLQQGLDDFVRTASNMLSTKTEGSAVPSHGGQGSMESYWNDIASKTSKQEDETIRVHSWNSETEAIPEEEEDRRKEHKSHRHSRSSNRAHDEERAARKSRRESRDEREREREAAAGLGKGGRAKIENWLRCGSVTGVPTPES